MSHVLFRADGSSTLGMGHVMRCLALAEAFDARGLGSLFLTRRSEEGAEEVIADRGHVVRHLPTDISFSEEVKQAQDAARESEACLVVTDICHDQLLKRRDMLDDYHRRLSEECFTICLAGAYATDIPAHVVVNPYVCAEAPKTSDVDDRTFLIGPEYFIFRNEFIEAAGFSRLVAARGKNLLVTAGGGENRSLLKRLARAIRRLPSQSIEVRIVLGTASGPGGRDEIEKHLKRFRGTYEILDQTSAMADLMLWADLAIIGDGLTKYEAAVTGTPSLMVLRPGNPGELSRAFAETGATHLLGPWTRLDAENLADTIHRALLDRSWRKELSRAGKALVDVRGRERILESISNELTAL